MEKTNCVIFFVRPSAFLLPVYFGEMCVTMRVLAGRLAGRVRLEKFERKGKEGIRVSH